jgi:hypothetical protein
MSATQQISRSRLRRIAIAVLVAAAMFTGQFLSALASGPGPAGTGSTGLASDLSHLTAEQAQVVVWAEARFAEAGLELPTIPYRFHDHEDECDGHRGIYRIRTGMVEMCTTLEKVMLHEMAHAWAEANMTARDKAEFVARRGLPTWGSRKFPWEERGTEHVAEILAWGLVSENILVRWVDEADGNVPRLRLLTIPNTYLEDLLVECRLITGLDPVLRDPSEWDLALAAPHQLSPEGHRYGTGG